MYQAIKHLPMELTKDPNFRNHFYIFEAYSFIMNEVRCNELHNISRQDLKQAYKSNWT